MLMAGIQFTAGEHEFQLFHQQWKGLVQMVCIRIAEPASDTGAVGKVMQPVTLLHQTCPETGRHGAGQPPPGAVVSFCLSCRGRLILQTDAQGAWFEHDLHALTAQQKTDCVVLNPEKSHPYIDDMAMFLSPLPVVLEWHCVMCGQHFPGKKFCEACGTGIYSRAVCTKYVYSYQPDLFLDCGSAST